MTKQQQLFVIDQVRSCMKIVRHEQESQLMHSNINWKTALQMGGSCVIYGEDSNASKNFVPQQDILKASVLLILQQDNSHSDIVTQTHICNIIIQRVCSQIRVCNETQFALTEFIQSVVEQKRSKTEI
jgi:hypothetical protein